MVHKDFCCHLLTSAMYSYLELTLFLDGNPIETLGEEPALTNCLLNECKQRYSFWTFTEVLS